MEDDPLDPILLLEAHVLEPDAHMQARGSRLEGHRHARPVDVHARPVDAGVAGSHPERALRGWPPASVSPDELATWFG